MDNYILFVYPSILCLLILLYIYLKKMDYYFPSKIFYTIVIGVILLFLYSISSPFYKSSLIRNDNKVILQINHNSGFFSCCSIKLSDIIVYFNLYKKIPDYVDSSTQFSWYKNDINKDKDITFDYFKPPLGNITYVNNIVYNHNDQFAIYKNFQFDPILPFITTYFSPSDNIVSIKNTIKNKYNINSENTCVLFYRGNDKNTETGTCSYDDMIRYGKEVQLKEPSIRFMIQSDETDFITKMTKVFPNSFICKDEIRHMNNKNSTVDKVFKNDNYEFSKNYLAITLLMAEANYLICGSGNCSIWIIFYRKHTNRLYQFLDGKWYLS